MLNQEKYNQLIKQFEVKEKQTTVYMSNRNFTTLDKLFKEKKIKSTHIPFAFSYLYFQNYMFRYAKYSNYVPQTSQIKELLGYNATNQSFDYLIKKDGILDSNGITETIYDFPLVQSWDEELFQVDITMLSDLDIGNYSTEWRAMNKVKGNQSCKYPIFAFYGEHEKYEGVTTDNFGGSFFEVENTTNIDINVFLYCMSNSDLESTGFYLYSYLKWKCDCTEKKVYGIGYERLAAETNLSVRTIKKYIKLLRQYNLIKVLTGTYVIYEQGESINKNDLEPNRYIINNHWEFSDYKFDELSKPTYISSNELKKNKQVNIEIDKQFNQLFD